MTDIDNSYYDQSDTLLQHEKSLHVTCGSALPIKCDTTTPSLKNTDTVPSSKAIGSVTLRFSTSDKKLKDNTNSF